MTKSNPIGVRFDTNLLQELKDASIATTPQQALILYEQTYLKHVQLSILENNQPENKSRILKERSTLSPTKEPMPTWDRITESWAEYKIRLTDWETRK